MIAPEELSRTVKQWLKQSPGAAAAADLLLDRAERDGRIPNQVTFDSSRNWHSALAPFFSEEFLRVTNDGRKCRLLFARWEQETIGRPGAFLPVLAKVRNRKVRNRKKEVERRVQLIRSRLENAGLRNTTAGAYARRELERLTLRKGTAWSRFKNGAVAEVEREIARYLRLLDYVDELRTDPARVERVVHVSRAVAGDTHWLRPENEIWNLLSDDLADLDEQFQGLAPDRPLSEKRAAVLSQVGIVENLTSVAALVFGRFGLERRGLSWNWPAEAAKGHLPVWLSALHLAGARAFSQHPVERVISVENETSLFDLIEEMPEESRTVLVYTAGQANRAVIALLRMLAGAFPKTRFYHQGDLDLPGVRILGSLRERSGLDIKPMQMDAETHRRFVSQGIPLSEKELSELEQAIGKAILPCKDLLREIQETGKRIEQENITASLLEKEKKGKTN